MFMEMLDVCYGIFYEICKLFKQNRISIGNELVNAIVLDIVAAFVILSTIVATATTGSKASATVITTAAVVATNLMLLLLLTSVSYLYLPRIN